MSECMPLITVYRDAFEHSLIPLFEMLRSPELIDFDDDLSLIIGNIIQRCKSITEIEITVIR